MTIRERFRAWLCQRFDLVEGGYYRALKSSADFWHRECELARAGLGTTQRAIFAYKADLDLADTNIRAQIAEITALKAAAAASERIQISSAFEWLGALDEKNDAISDLLGQVADRDTALGHFEAMLSERNEQNDQLASLLNDRNTEIAHLKERVAVHKTKITRGENAWTERLKAWLAETERLRLEIEKLTDDKAELQRRLQRRDPSTGRYAKRSEA